MPAGVTLYAARNIVTFLHYVCPYAVIFGNLHNQELKYRSDSLDRPVGSHVLINCARLNKINALISCAADFIGRDLDSLYL